MLFAPIRSRPKGQSKGMAFRRYRAGDGGISVPGSEQFETPGPEWFEETGQEPSEVPGSEQFEKLWEGGDGAEAGAVDRVGLLMLPCNVERNMDAPSAEGNDRSNVGFQGIAD